MESDKFYVQLRERVFGPFTRTQLVSYVATGKLKGAFSISTDRRKWDLADSVDWLHPAAPVSTNGEKVAPETLSVPKPPTKPAALPVMRRILPTAGVLDQTPVGNGTTEKSNGLVFISHASKNAKEAQYLVAALEAAGVPCWIAPRNIPAGSHYPHEIMTALQRCSTLLLIYSRSSVDSRAVDSEVERAFSRGVPIVPVRLEDCKPSPSLEFLTGKCQWIDVFPAPVSRHAQKVVAGVKSALGMAHEMSSIVCSGAEYLGNFLLLEKLGEGGMGVVRKAEQRAPMQRIVAIKLIKAGFDSEKVLARFESERQAHARMNHPNIARVLEAGATEQGRPYFVMEYVPGIPITDFADKQRLSIRERLQLFLQVCDAIGHAHSKQILHRDIKPGNVLAFVSPEGVSTIKVIDFGIAKALSGDGLGPASANTTVGDVIGTSAYMSPEQAEGSPDLDTRSDVYALGCLLYELLTGTAPLQADTLKVSQVEAQRIIREVDPPAPSARLTSLGGEAGTKVAHSRHSKIESLVKELKSEVEWIPMMAMRKERQRRYESPLQLAEDIRNYLEARPLIAAPDSRMYKFRKFSARHRKMVAVAAAAIIATVFYVVNVTKAERRVQREERIAKSVNQILSNMLTSVDPKTNKSTLTIAEAIYNFTVQLESEETNEPLVDASVWNTVGDVQRTLQDYDQAESHLTHAIDICNTLDASDPEVKRCKARAMDNLGHVWKDRISNKTLTVDAVDGEKLFNQALAEYNGALDLFKQLPAYDDRDLEIATTRANRASLLHLHDKKDKAALADEVADCRIALELRRKGKKPTDPQVLQSTNALAVALAVQREFNEALKLSADAVRLAGSVPQGPELVTASAYFTQAKVLTAYGEDLTAKQNYHEAEEELARAVDAAKSALAIDEKVFAKSPRPHYYIQNCRELMDKSLRKLIAVLQINNKPTDERDAQAKDNRVALDRDFPSGKQKNVTSVSPSSISTGGGKDSADY